MRYRDAIRRTSHARVPQSALIMMAILAGGFVLSVTYGVYRLADSSFHHYCSDDRPDLFATPPPSAASSFAIDLAPSSGGQLIGTIIFTPTAVMMGGSETFALIIRNTGTQPLELRKEDFSFIGGFINPDGSTKVNGSTNVIGREVTPWEDTVPPGATVRNDFSMTTPRGGSGSAIATEWQPGGGNGIRVPIQEMSKLAHVRQEVPSSC